MTVVIEPCGEVSVIAPLLRVLRDGLEASLFEARLTRAIAGGYHALVARGDGGVLGCLGYRLCDDICWGRTFYVDDLVVLPQARGSGVGGALWDAAKAEGAAQGCDHLRLCSGLSRAEAHRFYEANGLARTSLQFFFALPDGEL
ncbi:GNAT family N-acetyltransferase [Alphaproteobacteria bacterium KMM 3653]|uniref:GNAT family N-acetyltransferase n=1 Tax=Harenicola maris TaxID=2841044 RepID=A0AAP2CRT6_9RHOB|nr:GNAT family N-acetyltransferase [Harenicola maris]